MTLTGDDAVKQSDLSEYSIIRVPAEDRQLGQTIPPRNPHVCFKLFLAKTEKRKI